MYRRTISEKTQVVAQKASAGHEIMLSILKGIKDRSSEKHPYFGLGQDSSRVQQPAPVSSFYPDLDSKLLCEETPQLAICRKAMV